MGIDKEIVGKKYFYTKREKSLVTEIATAENF